MLLQKRLAANIFLERSASGMATGCGLLHQACNSADTSCVPKALDIYGSLESGDADFVRHVLGLVARARGMAGIAKKADLNRESLYEALGETGNPEFGTVMRIVRALGLTLSARRMSRAQQNPSRHRLCMMGIAKSSTHPARLRAYASGSGDAGVFRYLRFAPDLDLAIEAACLEFECRNFELTRAMALRTLPTVR